MSNLNEAQNPKKPVNLLVRLTIAEVLSERMKAMATSETMLAILDKRIEKCLTDIVDDAFSSWGDFSKGAKEAFKAALPGNLDSVIDLGRYNTMIEQRLRDAFADSNISNDMMAKAERALKDAMDDKSLPPVIMLSALIQAFIDDNAEYACEEQQETPDLRLEEDNRYSNKYAHFYFDKSKKESRYGSKDSVYNLDNNLAMRAIPGEEINGNQVYEVYSAKIDDQFVQRMVNTNLMNRDWEKMVFALYYGQSKICIDCDPDDFSYPGNDY